MFIIEKILDSIDEPMFIGLVVLWTYIIYKSTQPKKVR